jgi:hypothetical protein
MTPLAVESRAPPLGIVRDCELAAQAHRDVGNAATADPLEQAARVMLDLVAQHDRLQQRHKRLQEAVRT